MKRLNRWKGVWSLFMDLIITRKLLELCKQIRRSVSAGGDRVDVGAEKVSRGSGAVCGPSHSTRTHSCAGSILSRQTSEYLWMSGGVRSETSKVAEQLT